MIYLVANVISVENSGRSKNLDTRLLRFRNQASSEDAVSLAEGLLQAGRAAEAVEVSSVGLTRSPGSDELLILHGRASMADGELLRAQASFLRAARTAPKSAEPYRWLAEVLELRGDTTRARRVLQRALGIDAQVEGLAELEQRLAPEADEGVVAAADGANTSDEPMLESGPGVQGTLPGVLEVNITRRDEAPDSSALLMATIGERPQLTAEKRASLPEVVAPEEPVDLPATFEVEPEPVVEESVAVNEAELAVDGFETLLASDAAQESLDTDAEAEVLSSDDTSQTELEVKVDTDVREDVEEILVSSPVTQGAASVDSAGLAEIFGGESNPATESSHGNIMAPGVTLDDLEGEDGPKETETGDLSSDELASTGSDTAPMEARVEAAEALTFEMFSEPDDTEEMDAGDLLETASVVQEQETTDIEDVSEELSLDNDEVCLVEPEPSTHEGETALASTTDSAVDMDSDEMCSVEPEPSTHEGETALASTTDSAVDMDSESGDTNTSTDSQETFAEAAETEGDDYDTSSDGPTLEEDVYESPNAELIHEFAGDDPVDLLAESGGEELVAESEPMLSLEEAQYGEYASQEGTEQFQGAEFDSWTEDAPVTVPDTSGQTESSEDFAALMAAATADSSIAEDSQSEGSPEDEHLEPWTIDAAPTAVTSGFETQVSDETKAAELDVKRTLRGMGPWADLSGGEARKSEPAPLAKPEVPVLALAEDEGALTEPAPGPQRAPSVDDDVAESLEALADGESVRPPRLSLEDESQPPIDIVAPTDSLPPVAIPQKGWQGAQKWAMAAAVLLCLGGGGYLALQVHGATQGEPSSSALASATDEALSPEGNEREVLAVAEAPEQTDTAQEAVPQDTGIVEARAALDSRVREQWIAASATVDARATELDPPDPVLSALSIRLRLRLDPDAALLDAAQAIASGAEGDADVALAVVEAALAERDFRTAINGLNRLAAAGSEGVEEQVLFGRALRLSGDHREAEARFRSVLESDAAHVEARLQLASLLVESGRYEQAEELFATLGGVGGHVGELPVATAVTLGRAELAVKQGRLAEAVSMIDGMELEAVHNEFSLPLRAHLAIARGRATRVLPALRQAVQLDTGNTDLTALYGDALYASGRRGMASVQYERVLRLDPAHPEALLGLGYVLLRADKLSDAANKAQRLRTALRTRPRSNTFRSQMLLLEARVRLRSQSRADARRAVAPLREAAAIPGAPAEVWFFLGESLAGYNSPAAREAYGRYLELAPQGTHAAVARRATGN